MGKDTRDALLVLGALWLLSKRNASSKVAPATADTTPWLAGGVAAGVAATEVGLDWEAILALLVL